MYKITAEEIPKVRFLQNESHTLTDVCSVTDTAECSACGLTKIRIRNGKASCIVVNSEEKRQIVNRIKYLKPYCERCQFVADHLCQLDLNHKDGDRQNISKENLETLCANCHRLVTYESKHVLNRYPKPRRSSKPVRLI